MGDIDWAAPAPCCRTESAKSPECRCGCCLRVFGVADREPASTCLGAATSVLAALRVDLEDIDWYSSATVAVHYAESNQEHLAIAPRRADQVLMWLGEHVGLERTEALALLELSETMHRATFNAHPWEAGWEGAVRDAYRALQLAAGDA